MLFLINQSVITKCKGRECNFAMLLPTGMHLFINATWQNNVFSPLWDRRRLKINGNDQKCLQVLAGKPQTSGIKKTCTIGSEIRGAEEIIP